MGNLRNCLSKSFFVHSFFRKNGWVAIAIDGKVEDLSLQFLISSIILPTKFTFKIFILIKIFEIYLFQIYRLSNPFCQEKLCWTNVFASCRDTCLPFRLFSSIFGLTRGSNNGSLAFKRRCRIMANIFGCILHKLVKFAQ